jgi:putative aldouronate transport system substrate-binding protein
MTGSRFRVGIVALMAIACLAAGWASAQKEGAASGSQARARISYMIQDNGRYPTAADKHIVLRELGRKLNIEWDLVVVPATEYGSKFSVTMASGDIPDISMYRERDWPTVLPAYGRAGYLLDVKPYLSRMPNLVRNFLDKVPDSLKNSMTDDGKLYYIGRYKTTTADGFSPAFSYRKDVFDKNGMTPGRTFDAFYANLKQLKGLYPDKYPFSVPNGTPFLVSQFSPLFETGVSQGYITTPSGVYYDFWSPQPRFVEGGTNANYKQMLQFLNRLYAEGLMHQEFAAKGSANYQKLVVNNQIFMGINGSLVDVETLNVAGRKESGAPAFEWMFADYPSFKGPGRTYSYLDVDAIGKVIGGKTRNLDRILQLVNAMCSDEYMTLQAYGVEGETFTRDAKGQPQFVDKYKDAQSQWALGLGEDYTAIIGHFPGMQEAANSELSRRQLAFYKQSKAGLPDEPYLAFTDAEIKDLKQYDPLNTYLAEMGHKFIIGEESFANWDKYVARCKQLGIEKKVAIYNQAMDRYARRTP